MWYNLGMEYNKSIVRRTELKNLRSLKDLLDFDRLGEFEYAKGNEATAYFLDNIDRPLVLKEYIEEVSEFYPQEFGLLFERYCEEVNKLVLHGVKLPNFYDWFTRKNKNGNSIYYILQDRVKGRELFNVDPFTFYKNIYIGNANFTTGDGLINEAVAAYICDYIMVNEFLADMPESELESFIISAVKMYSDTRYMVPDIHAKNVILNTKEQTLTHIDPFMIDKSHDSRYYSDSRAEFEQLISDNIVFDLVNMFKTNNFANLFSDDKYIKVLTDDKRRLFFERLIKRNTMMCEASISRVLKVMNRLLQNPNFANKKLLSRTINTINSIFSREQAERVVKNINGASTMA